MWRVWTLILLISTWVHADEAPGGDADKQTPPVKPAVAAGKKAAKKPAKKPAKKKVETFLLRYELARGKRFIGSNTVSFDIKHTVRTGNNKKEVSHESVERTERFRDHIKSSSSRGPVEIERQYQRLFTKVRNSERGRPDVDQNPLQGHTVIITERRRSRSIRATKGLAIPPFVRKTVGIEIDWRDVLPRERVQVGDAWEADAEAFARRLAPYLDSGSRARMIVRFESIEIRDGARCAKFYVDLTIDGMRDRQLFTKAQLAGDAIFDMSLKRFVMIDLAGSFIVRGAILGKGLPKIIQAEGKASYKSALREVRVSAAAPPK